MEKEKVILEIPTSAEEEAEFQEFLKSFDDLLVDFDNLSDTYDEMNKEEVEEDYELGEE